jgi:hypothetical protein
MEKFRYNLETVEKISNERRKTYGRSPSVTPYREMRQREAR